MTNYNFETVSVAAGAFIGWHDQPGQVITGKVLDYNPTGGQDFAGGVCPQIALELVEAASSFNKQGDRTDFPAGEMVTITAGQANLRRGVIAAQLNTGDIVRITHSSNAKTANGTAKIFEIQVARGAGGQSAPSSMNPGAPGPLPGAQTVTAPAAAPAPPF